jgi:3',5'-cyclic AMP phosphodiesterase CpdA
VATDSKIEVGTVYGSYTHSATNPQVTKEHHVRITGLCPGKKYYYRFGSSTRFLQSARSNYFYTAPYEDFKGKIRIAAFGDCGRNNKGFRTGSLKSYLKYVGKNPAEIMLLLGDNAYNDGTDYEYQTRFFNAYSRTILKNHVLFPAPGNHDYRTTPPSERTAPYFKIFSMPTAGECGGVPSGTQAYYSFNWGNAHFISLDSHGTEAGSLRLYDTLSPQVTWIKKDLEANNKEWVIVYWHHPPFTMGSHNSDKEGDLIRIRQNFIRILERYGVDLVLCGHSHNYERSYLLNNYYSNEASFDPKIHTKSSSSGKYDGSKRSCPYITTSGKGNRGTVYVVSGSAGADGGIQPGYPHNALPFSIDNGGMFYFEIENNRLDAKFIRRDGVVADQFTIFHDVAKTIDITINPGSPVQLSSTWMRDHTWSTGQTSRAITVRPVRDTAFKVTDSLNCLADVFNISVANANPEPSIPETTKIKEENKLNQFR